MAPCGVLSRLSFPHYALASIDNPTNAKNIKMSFTKTIETARDKVSVACHSFDNRPRLSTQQMAGSSALTPLSCELFSSIETIRCIEWHSVEGGELADVLRDPDSFHSELEQNSHQSPFIVSSSRSLSAS